MSRKGFLSIIVMAVVLSGTAACNDNLRQGTIDLGIDDEVDDPKQEEKMPTITLSHPCAYVNSNDISRVKAAVTKADASDPVFVSWQKLISGPYTQKTYKPNPQETLVRGDPKGTGVSSENYIVADQDAAAAFQLALCWKVSGDNAYASAAINVLNSWAAKCKKITANDNNQYLLAGFQGHTFANAAELLRDCPEWSASDQDKFKKWLKDVWYAKSYWFVENHGGANTCPLHYWSNWELANLASLLAIGIYTDDKAAIEYVYERFHKGEGSGCVNNMIPYNPIKDPDGKSNLIAQSMESGRDQGHATLVVSICAELCRMAQNVGLDFWEAEDNKVLAMCEYTAKYNVKPNGFYIATSMPFTTYKYCVDCSCKDHNHGATHTTISDNGRGTVRPCWDLIYAHYVKEAGLPANYAYYTKLFADQLRYTSGVLTGDGGAGDSRYGSASGAYDQLGWGTLLFYQGI